MFRFSPISRVSTVAGIVFAALAWVGSAAPAAAQASSPPRIPPDAKGYQTTMILQQYHRERGTAPVVTAQVARPSPRVPARPAVAEPAALIVTVTRPVQGLPFYVDVRESDGSVRTFPVEGGRAAIQRQTETFVVRPGESATIRLVVRAPGR